jgi:hypothetical protein
MYKTLAAAILALSIASPVLAQSYDPDLGTGNLTTVPAYSSVAPANHRVLDAFAQADHGASTAGSIARDPDASIRFDLNREAQLGW